MNDVMNEYLRQKEHSALLKLKSFLEACLNGSITITEARTETDLSKHIYALDWYMCQMLAITQYGLNMEVPKENKLEKGEKRNEFN